MNEHEQIRKSLPGLAAGTLPPAEATAARAHLEACRDCAREAALWQRLGDALERLPEEQPVAARLERIQALAAAHREEILARRWNRLVLAGLVVYGWALFMVSWPFLPAVIGWLGERLALPWLAAILLTFAAWWGFTGVIGLGLLPLLRAQRKDWAERIT